jgi:hypothetical protein
MLMTMDTKSASNAWIDRAPYAAPRALAGPWHRASTAFVHSIGDRGEPIADVWLRGAHERRCVRPSISKPSKRAVPDRYVFRQTPMNFAMADTREVSPVRRAASVEPFDISSRPGEFYSEFYRGGFFVVASTSQVAVFTGGKWWAV